MWIICFFFFLWKLSLGIGIDQHDVSIPYAVLNKVFGWFFFFRSQHADKKPQVLDQFSAPYVNKLFFIFVHFHCNTVYLSMLPVAMNWKRIQIGLKCGCVRLREKDKCWKFQKKKMEFFNLINSILLPAFILYCVCDIFNWILSFFFA